jgi:hypothetical protein
MEVELAPSVEHDDYMQRRRAENERLRAEKERQDTELAEAAMRWVQNVTRV